jgi:DNA polymerase III epsilon subunit-like protein
MPRKVFILDFESTGIDPTVCRPTEVALGEYDPESRKVLSVVSYLMFDSTYPPISKEVEALTGISSELLADQGTPPKKVFESLCQTFAAEPGEKDTIIVAHNGAIFDEVLFREECSRHGLVPPRTIWIDSRRDIKYMIQTNCRVLSHLALEHGFKVDPAGLHRAEADINLLSMVLSKYEFKEIFKRAVAPRIVLHADVPFDRKDEAKDRGFRWQKINNDDPRIFTKKWVKEIIKPELEEEIAAAKFPINVVG